MDGSRSVYHQSTGTGTGTGTTTGTGAGAGGIADPAKAKAKAEAAAKEAEDLTEAQRLAAAATYGGERAFAEMPAARRRDLLVDAWLLMHAPAQERAEREKRQHAAGADPASVPLEKTLKNYWRNERERAARQGKILALIHDAEVAAMAGEVAEAARPALAEFTAFGASASAGGAS